VLALALVGLALVALVLFATVTSAAALDDTLDGMRLAAMLGGESAPVADPMTSWLEIAAYCRQAEVCRALARTSALPACRGRETPVCPVCRRRDRSQ
jgi:hypothetical protein